MGAKAPMLNRPLQGPVPKMQKQLITCGGLILSLEKFGLILYSFFKKKICSENNKFRFNCQVNEDSEKKYAL